MTGSDGPDEYPTEDELPDDPPTADEIDPFVFDPGECGNINDAAIAEWAVTTAMDNAHIEMEKEEIRDALAAEGITTTNLAEMDADEALDAVSAALEAFCHN